VLGAVVLVGGLGYLFIRSGGLSAVSSGDDSQLAQVAQRLDEIEKRLDELEKRRRPASAEPAKPEAKENPSGSPAAPPPVRVAPAATRPRAEGSPAPNVVYDRRISGLEQDVNTLRGDVTASREAWEATTDRLADTAGELGEHREEMARLREHVNQLAQRTERSYVTFNLRKGSDRQRVGPVWLVLRGTDVKNQRYTVRLFVDEKWVEMKDRAAHEPVEFYLSGVQLPLEVVVSDIGKDWVLGYLSMPKEAVQR